MLIIYKKAEEVLGTVRWEMNNAYHRSTAKMDRLRLLESMLIQVEPDMQVAVDEEIFKFLNM